MSIQEARTEGHNDVPHDGDPFAWRQNQIRRWRVPTKSRQVDSRPWARRSNQSSSSVSVVPAQPQAGSLRRAGEPSDEDEGHAREPELVLVRWHRIGHPHGSRGCVDAQNVWVPRRFIRIVELGLSPE